jgi:molybdopterin-guanine dinucleotide biosynthesis protein A
MDALILAGGENRRIPVIKGFLQINGKRIIDTTIDLLGGVFTKIGISTNNPELYFSLGLPMVGDIINERGPMTGIFSVLTSLESHEVFVTACDMPFINVILVQYMIERWDNKRDALVPIFEEKPQPFPGIYSKEIVRKMEESIWKGKKGLRGFLEEIDVLYLREEEVRNIDKDGRSFVNINTLEDFQREGGKVCLA